ncbi:hypothetical protein FD754_005910 [Muntiacus muntjak]|uniref:Uncharacterized protein n=1 Tax=Muntiacus muntjak TaxID=9888 RepID=A0A5N3WJU7_MUNMU|nr:hypothetical protein FD754_005910 [Muntiacus muntjak]
MHVVCKLKYFYLKIMGHFSHSKLKVSTAFFSPYYLDNMSCRHRWVIYTTEMNGKNTFWDVDGSMVPPECTPGFALPYYIPKLLLRLMSVELMIPSNHLIHCCPPSCL